MTPSELAGLCRKKRSCLCVGLDTDLDKIPSLYKNSANPVFAFNQSVISATCEYAVAYKLNLAFYEQMGLQGWQNLIQTLQLIPNDVFTIADAKRGDIGNSSGFYAKAFFESLGFDAITVFPYMGSDSVAPFLAFNNKWVFLLALTSNSGSHDFQTIEGKDGQPLWQRVIKTAETWPKTGQLGYVMGATQAQNLTVARSIAPDAWFLVPGVGTQGGDLHAVLDNGFIKQVGLLVNVSRDIIYPNQDFLTIKAHELAMKAAAAKYQQVMAPYFIA